MDLMAWNGSTPGGVFSDFGEAVKPPNTGSAADEAFEVCSRTPSG